MLSRAAIYGVLFLLTGILLSDCNTASIIGGPVGYKELADGTYEGSSSSWPNTASVTVTITGGKIVDIKIVRSRASWIGKKAEPVIPLRIIEQQSTDVDAVTGATNSSRVIMNAVQDALDRSYR